MELPCVSIHNQHPPVITSVHATGASQRTRPTGAGYFFTTTSTGSIHGSDLIPASQGGRFLPGRSGS